MKSFAALVIALGASTKTNDKLQALINYFGVADDADKVWVIALFSGRRPKRSVSTSLLQQWCTELTQMPGWLFQECYHTVGDLAETIALLLPPPQEQLIEYSLTFYIDQLKKMDKEDEEKKKAFITSCWMQMDTSERFVFNKLITGGFRIGISQNMMVNALAKMVQLDAAVIAHRISGNWDPSTTSFTALLNASSASDHSKPYPFYLAYALEDTLHEIGHPNEWQAEWKWDGIRGQLIHRNNELFVWSRGEELVTEKFPEYYSFKEYLPSGIVLDGEIICMKSTTEHSFQPLPFSLLQTRIGRKNISKKQLTEAPVAFIAYDLLEFEGQDIRHKPLVVRRSLLENIINKIPASCLQVSPIIYFSDWNELAALRLQARDNGSEGVMLKRKKSVYQAGRRSGDWWKWKIDPLTIDAVLVYAQKGHGRRSNLYTDYTFAVKDGDKLVTFTKAYSGLSDKEFTDVDAFVKKNSLEKFGPVRTVHPELVFEIAFEGIAASNRHKSGVALRFPRISRWRKDKKPDEINTLEDLKRLLHLYQH
ncbi:MAG: ATP-dependent DNA ligase [Bacteroidota bacterium]|nr:ATP-dependent DNA ligase [Bacteroidota bacterium]